MCIICLRVVEESQLEKKGSDKNREDFATEKDSSLKGNGCHIDKEQ